MPSSSSIALARLAVVRLQRDRVEGDEGEDQLLDLAGGAEHADVRTAVGHHGQVLQVGAQHFAHQGHRLAPRAPAADADGHAGAQLRYRSGRRQFLVECHSFVLGLVI
jgi:hypothetical protein